MKSEYSESGKSINYGGRISISTTKGQKYFNTELTIAYNQNLLYEGIDQTKRFTASPTPYKFSIENVGGEINIKELSL